MIICKTIIPYLIFGLSIIFAPICLADVVIETLVTAARERIDKQVRYDGAYVSIDYPMGDVPESQGVCTDLVIRAYRKLGVDLQQLVHEDMRANFEKYPSLWGLSKPDSNIDHRRVPNLQVFFKRHGEALQISNSASDYRPADVVTWMLPGNLPHIGIISNIFAADKKTPLVIHNIGNGPEENDNLFAFPITGHFRYATK